MPTPDELLAALLPFAQIHLPEDEGNPNHQPGGETYHRDNHAILVMVRVGDVRRARELTGYNP